jgi:S1-C subfamily serine protease
VGARLRGNASSRLLVLIALAAGLVLGCAGYREGRAIAQYRQRMLASSSELGATRLRTEEDFDPVFRGYIAGRGAPDYIYVVDARHVILLYVAADQAIIFTRKYTSMSTISPLRPIPDDLTKLVDSKDQRRVQAIRAAGGAPGPVAAGPGQTLASFGTCFAVGPHGEILTAQHVVEHGSKIAVRLVDGRVLPATVTGASGATDLALLHVDAATPDYLTPAIGAAKMGGRVFTLGYPAIDLLGPDPKFVEGQISALSGPGGDASFLQISVPVQPGNSGGPLVTETGQLVGVVVATARLETFLSSTGTIPQNVNWATRSEAITTFVPPARQPDVSRDAAIERVRKSLCMVAAEL